MVGQDLSCPSTNALYPFYSYMFFSIFASLQERKLRDLEVELETRAKAVKARVAELDIQVRAWGGGQDLQVPFTLES